MKTRNDQLRERRRHMDQRGFTLVEVLLAIAVLLIGVVAVAQLVPASVGANSSSRNDSSALVFAQRQMDMFLRQSLNMSVSPPNFTETLDLQTFTCYLGDPTQPNQVVGSPVITVDEQVLIDFAQATVPNYSFAYQDSNDPAGVKYDARWAVVTTTNNGMVSSKRFILGVRKLGGNGIYRPATLDTLIER